MQDLSSAIKALKDATDSIKAGGWMAVAVLVAILAFLLLKPILARGRKATQEVNLTLPSIPGNGTNGYGKMCPAHSGFQARLDQVAQDRIDNKSEHGNIFDKLDTLSADVRIAANSAEIAAAAAEKTAEAAKMAVYSRQVPIQERP